MQSCQAYWPEEVGASRTFGDLEVTLKSEEMSSLVDCLTIRELTLTNNAKVTKLLLGNVLRLYAHEYTYYSFLFTCMSDIVRGTLDRSRTSR